MCSKCNESKNGQTLKRAVRFFVTDFSFVLTLQTFNLSLVTDLTNPIYTKACNHKTDKL